MVKAIVTELDDVELLIPSRAALRRARCVGNGPRGRAAVAARGATTGVIPTVKRRERYGVTEELLATPHDKE